MARADGGVKTKRVGNLVPADIVPLCSPTDYSRFASLPCEFQTMPNSTRRMRRFKLQMYLLLSTPHPEFGPRISFFRFGIPLVMKKSDRTVSTEGDALRFLNDSLPHLPIPKLVDSFILDDVTYTVMTKFPGKRLSDVPDLSAEDMAFITKDVSGILRELWRIPQPPSISGKVMRSASGHGLPHPRMPHARLGGPYDSTLRCYQGMFARDLASCPPSLTEPLARDPVVWVHTDLRAQNILVQDGQLAGIVDWEDSGWLPMHWQLYVLRDPCAGCVGAWARYWKVEHRFNIISEAAYEASLAEDMIMYHL